VAVILETRGLSKHFRGLQANADIDFRLEEGQVRCVIGPNGAGKTTFISMISGHLAPSSGSIRYRDADITDYPLIRRARLGIGRKFQTPSVFGGLTVYQNIELAALAADAPRSAHQQLVEEAIGLVRLGEHRHVIADHLSHGERQWLEIGLLLAVRAQLLLLDEPTAGMTGEETAATADLVNRLSQDRGLSIIIIEHDINFIRALAAPVTVLHLGKVLREGSYAEIAEDQQVRDVYLGYQ
jgi:ABC-type uncharacterized transport system ATPase subunit